MTQKKFLPMVGIVVIAIIYFLNVSNAVNHYGILSNNLWTQVFAQGSSSSGGGSSTGGGSYKDPCKTVTEGWIFWDECDGGYKDCGHYKKWWCVNFGKEGTDCRIGFELEEYDCEGNLVCEGSSNTDVSYTCMF